MVHFPGLARARLWIQRTVSRVQRDGFPHSDISGSRPACGSPKLFAACHVLHRLLAPRHPPYALSSLTIKLADHAAHPLAESFAVAGKFAFFQVALIRNLWLAHAHVCLRKRLRLPLPHSVVKEPVSRAWRNLRKFLSQLLSENRPENKKPGVERRARPSLSDGPARCSTVFLSGIRNQPHLVGLETGLPHTHTL